MSFQLRRKDRTTKRGLRRIAASQIASALKALDDGKASDGEKVHGVRTHAKKLRAMLWLDGSKAARRLEDKVGKIARRLAGHRDAAVRLETFDALIAGHAPAPEIRERLVAEAGKKIEIGNQLSDTRKALKKLKKSFSRGTCFDDGMISGVEETYRKARRMFRAVETAPEDEACHEARKPIKYHLHHLTLLSGLVTGELRAQRALAGQVEDGLGQHHNLSVLKLFLQEQPEKADAERLTALAIERQKSVLDHVLPLGRALLADKPKAMARPLRRALRDWTK